jgi:carbon monoxide dehydrogenase subunit G
VNISERAVIDAPLAEVWEFVTDVPRVGGCLPGTEHVTDLGEGAYGGAMRVKVGAIAVRLEGKVRMIEKDDSNHSATLAIEASDKRVKGSVTATTRMTLAAVDSATTELTLATDAAVVGKLGQFGQAVIHKKTKQILDEFVANMSQQLGGAELGNGRPVRDAATDDAAVRANGTRHRADRTRAVSSPPVPSTAYRAGGSTLGLLVCSAGVVAGVVGAFRSDTAWATLGLSLVLWGTLGFDRTRSAR